MRRLRCSNLYTRSFSKIATFIFAVFIALTTLMPLGQAAAQAANDNAGLNLVVSPVTNALETKPGVPVTEQMQVKNGNLTTEHIKVSLMKFSSQGEDGSPKLEDISSGDDFATWVNFSESKFDAEPNVWKTIDVTINPPASAAFGYYYAIVFSRDNATNQTQPQKTNLLGAVASLILLDVQAPGAKRQADLTEFSMSKKSFEFLPATFNVRLKNTGNVHVAPRGNIFISKGGKNVALLEVNQSQGYILPNGVRKFTATWEDGAPVYKVVTANGKVVLDKNDKQKTKLDWGNFTPSKLRFGKYTAHLVMVFNNGTSDVPLEGDISFWVIPWRIIGGILLVALLALAGLYALVLRPLKNRVKKSKNKK